MALWLRACMLCVNYPTLPEGVFFEVHLAAAAAAHAASSLAVFFRFIPRFLCVASIGSRRRFMLSCPARCCLSVCLSVAYQSQAAGLWGFETRLVIQPFFVTRSTPPSRTRLDGQKRPVPSQSQSCPGRRTFWLAGAVAASWNLVLSSAHHHRVRRLVHRSPGHIYNSHFSPPALSGDHTDTWPGCPAVAIGTLPVRLCPLAASS